MPRRGNGEQKLGWDFRGWEMGVFEEMGFGV